MISGIGEVVVIARFILVMACSFRVAAFAANVREAEYIVHYGSVEELENLRKSLSDSEFELLRESPELGAVLVRGPVGIARIRSLSIGLVVERVRKVSIARDASCARAVSGP